MLLPLAFALIAVQGGVASSAPPRPASELAGLASAGAPGIAQDGSGADTSVPAGPLFPGLGLLPSEIYAIQHAAPGSRLLALRNLAQGWAGINIPVPVVTPGTHLVTDANVAIVGASVALPLGFLKEYNIALDAFGIGYALTGNALYSDKLGQHLIAWGVYSPPMGLGKEEGGQPSIMHRNFYGLFRGAWNAWPGLNAEARTSAVQLARTLLARYEDWWSYTPWERGNQQAATNQTAIYAAQILYRAGESDPALALEGAQALLRFATVGQSIAPISFIGGDPDVPGVVGFDTQVSYGIYRGDLKPTYGTQFERRLFQDGISLDFLYKEPDSRVEYHVLLTHHLLTAYWALARNDLHQTLLPNAGKVRAQISRLIDYSRSLWETGQAPAGATGTYASAALDPQGREILGMAAKLFPEKTWIAPLLDLGPPLSPAEIHFEVAAPLDGIDGWPGDDASELPLGGFSALQHRR